MNDSHLAYNVSVARALSEELLLNIVRLRYRDGVQFLFVDSISAQYAIEIGSGSLLGRDQGATTALASPFIRYSDRPTITFLPRTDDEFVQKLTSPLEASILVSLSSFQPEFARLLRMAVVSLNGEFNLPGGRSSVFQRALDGFSRLERENKISMGFIEVRTELSGATPASEVKGESLIRAYQAGLRFENGPGDNTLQLVGDVARPSLFIVERTPDTDSLVQTLGLEIGQTRYPIRSNGSQQANDKGVLHLQTRSVIGIMQYLSRDVDVPEADRERGVVEPQSVGTGDLFRVRVSASKPSEAWVAVQHRGYWFYVSDADRESKRTFALIRAIFQLQVAGNEKRSGPLLTLPLD